MCTLTYVSGRQQAIITVNRDEAPSRAASSPEIREVNSRRYWLAPEPVSGSSNLVFDIINQRLHVLLNGAFESHRHNPPYRISRGVMLFDAFDFDSLQQMSDAYDFGGIEPFTLLSFHEGAWEELRWDESKVHYTNPSASDHAIWSSAKLYPKPEIEKRETEFHSFTSARTLLYPQQLFDIHKRNREDERGIGFRMNYEDRVKTVSITQLTFGRGPTLLRYLDLTQSPQSILERSF